MLQGQRDGAVSAIVYLCDAFSSWAAVRPHQPIGFGFPDLRRRKALIGTVIPFGEQPSYLIHRQAGQLGSIQRPSTRATDDNRVVKFEFTQQLTSQLCLRSPGIGQLDLGTAGAGPASTKRSRRGGAVAIGGCARPYRQIVPDDILGLSPEPLCEQHARMTL